MKNCRGMLRSGICNHDYVHDEGLLPYRGTEHRVSVDEWMHCNFSVYRGYNNEKGVI